MKPNILALSAIVALAIMLMVPFMPTKTAGTNENGELEEKEESSSEEEYIDERRFLFEDTARYEKTYKTNQ